MKFSLAMGRLKCRWLHPVGVGVSLLPLAGLVSPTALALDAGPAPSALQRSFDYSPVTIRDVLAGRIAQMMDEEERDLPEGPPPSDGVAEPLRPECEAFAAQPDADIGDVLSAGCKPTLAQMSALMDNPVGNVAMLFTQYDATQMENQGTKGPTKFKNLYTGIAQFPKGLSKGWNLINRIVWTVPSVPLSQSKIDNFAPASLRNYSLGAGGSFLSPVGAPPLPIDLFSGRTTGFGDLYYVGLFSPKQAPKIGNASLLWGVGFDAGFPTASRDILGTGKWQAGPAALLVYMGPKLKVGFLAQHYWDFAGDSSRAAVNLSNIQSFYYYSIDDVTSIGAGPNIIANWQQNGSNRWTVPVGIGINRTFQFGKIPVRIGLEAHYSVFQPYNVAAAKWNYRIYFIPAVPAAMFKWMQ